MKNYLVTAYTTDYCDQMTTAYVVAENVERALQRYVEFAIDVVAPYDDIARTDIDANIVDYVLTDTTSDESTYVRIQTTPSIMHLS